MRRGPAGPRTLCNACGLMWANKVCIVLVMKSYRLLCLGGHPFEIRTPEFHCSICLYLCDGDFMHFFGLVLIQMECFRVALFAVLNTEVFRLFLISSVGEGFSYFFSYIRSDR